MSNFKTISGLKGFCYYDVDEEFEMSCVEDLSFFKSKILESGEWFGESIKKKFYEKRNESVLFDSGVVCAKDSFEINGEGRIAKLECFMAPYKLMQTTIATLKKPSAVETKPKRNAYSGGIAVAIGMVLTIIATKGTAEKGNRTPYIVLVKRDNAGIRNDELDVAVVEGLNISDFSDRALKGIDRLHKIAKRALEEERGLNCGMLEARGLLHMPQKYYFGYDEQYRQWNFFGTVVIDCTIEEIVREGCYFTKDKFETKGIVGLPIEPKILNYFMEFEKVSGEKYREYSFLKNEGMWNTGWASISFAIVDFMGEREPKSIKDRSGVWKWVFSFRVRLNRLAERIAKREYGFNNFCAVWALALMLLTLIWAVHDGNSNILTIIVTIISSFVAFCTCWLVVACSRDKLVNRKDLIKLNTYWRGDESPFQSFQETFVFRNVNLIDGNIAEKQRKVMISCDKGNDNKGIVKVNRACKLFYDDSDKNNAWIMKAEGEPDRDIENIKWRIIRNDNCQNEIRIVIPCIIDRKKILFTWDNRDNNNSDGKLRHGIDLCIRYADLKKEDDCEEEIQGKIFEFMRNMNEQGHVFAQKKDISFRFLLNSDDQFTIVGFLEIENPSGMGIVYPLTQELSNTTFADESLLDDITRVACEYAYVEYMGYAISER